MKININRLLAVFLFGLFSAAFLHAVESAGQGKVEFNIRFIDRRIYYVNSDPIKVQIIITNNSPNPYRFKLADERVFSVDFDIRTMTNRRLPEADSLIRKRTQNTRIFFREIIIESGESFSFVEDLRDYANFTNPGSFRVHVKVYPELYSTASVSTAESNYLNLNLRPASIPGPDGIPLEMDVETGAVLVRQQLPPDEAVAYMLTARQQSQWERFFLYLDLESLLKNDAFQKRKFLAENEEGRKRMIADYRQGLKNSVIDGDIFVIPTSFEILRTVYDSNEGNVTVMQKIVHSSFTEWRRYIYYLEKKDDFWIIVNYMVESNGTEAND